MWLSDPDGGSLVELGTDAGRPNDWSPDGRQILFDGGRGGGRAADVFVISADGGAPRNLTNVPNDDVRANWSQDGKSIYFRSDRSGRNEIWKMPANGGEAVQITRNGGWEAQDSPDGKLLYVVKESADKNRARDNTRTGTPGGLWSLPVDGGPETMLITSVAHAYWCVTNRGIFFVDFTGPQDGLDPKPVRFFDFTTRRITQVASIEKNLQWGALNFSVTADGRRLLWAQIDHESADIMLVQGWKP